MVETVKAFVERRLREGAAPMDVHLEAQDKFFGLRAVAFSYVKRIERRISREDFSISAENSAED
jgi:hypothetical protein